ncbi:hypothetical protein V492_02612, partial [Pseudogymnoascus sp. VKM F-4246]
MHKPPKQAEAEAEVEPNKTIPSAARPHNPALPPLPYRAAIKSSIVSSPSSIRLSRASEASKPLLFEEGGAVDAEEGVVEDGAGDGW